MGRSDTEVHLARRTRYSRPLLAVLGTVAALVGVAGTYQLIDQDTAEASAGPAMPPAAVLSTPSASQPSKTGPQVDSAPRQPAAKSPAQSPVVLLDAPTTRPALALASRPAPTTPVDAVALFRDADAKIAADDLLGARDAIVAALDAKKFSDTERDAAYDRLGKINETVVFSSRKFLSDPHQLAHTVKSGDNMQKIANLYDVTYKFIGRVNSISDPRKMRLGANLKIVKGPFHAVVNKTAFTLDLYQGKPGQTGTVFVKRLRVGLGENDSTPTGLWKVTTKLENPTYYNPRDTGPRVIPAGDPTNPLGERWLALEGVSGQAIGKESYGIHGTIEPESIGKKKSMGCVRLLNEDVNLVYDLLIKDKSTVTVVE